MKDLFLAEFTSKEVDVDGNVEKTLGKIAESIDSIYISVYLQAGLLAICDIYTGFGLQRIRLP